MSLCVCACVCVGGCVHICMCVSSAAAVDRAVLASRGIIISLFGKPTHLPHLSIIAIDQTLVVNGCQPCSLLSSS